MFVSKEAILRKNPELKSEILDILKLDTKVDVQELIENDIENEYYYKVNYMGIEGYIIKTSLENEKRINEKRNIQSLSTQSKIKMLNEAIKILKQNTQYSAKLDNKFYESGKTRANGYYNIPFYEKDSAIEYYSYDCSAFCDTILNRVFDEKMTKEENKKIEIKDGIFKTNLWVTQDYFENSLLEDSNKKILDVVEFAKEENKEIHILNMEIGDFIVGIIDYENEKHNKKFIMNHIMMYMGDGYIVHASFSDGKQVFNKVLMTKLEDDFYTKVSFDKRFDKAILLARYKEKS